MEISRPHLAFRYTAQFWPTLLIGVLVVRAVVSLTLKPTFALLVYNVIVYFLLLLLSTAFAFRNAVQRTVGSRLFWIFMAGGCGLWSFDQWLNVYYGLILRADNVPDNSVADPALFLHIVPFMAAVAIQPQLHRSDQRPSRASLNFLLLLFFWIFLYAYVLFPYQYLFADAAIYNPRFTALYAAENAALVLALGASTLRTKAPWRSVYLHFLGASALYAVSSTVANIGIDAGWMSNRSVIALAQTAAVCWFVWIPLRAGQVPLAGKVTATELEAGDTTLATLLAQISVAAIPLIGMWELLRRHEASGMRTFRLSVVLISVLFLALGVFLREYLVKRDLLADSRKQAEVALRQSQAEMARVARIATMGELTASIAHEINQPLAAVVANGSASLRWLAMRPPNLDEAQEALKRVIQEGNRASGVVERIRGLLKKASPELRPVDVNDVIREVLPLVTTELASGGVALRTALADDVPAVHGDAVQLHQVMLNLIMNAIEATSMISDRPRELLIESATGPDGVLVRVHDSGKGVDPEHLHRVFEPFFTTKPHGIGMGLSIARTIVEAHGGRLWASPGSPFGAIFQFTLPVAEGAL